MCRRMNRIRTAYYKQINKQDQKVLESPIIHELVMEQRIDMPRLGGKKLYHLIGPELKAHQIKVGRDKLFGWLREQGLLIRPKKQYMKTTQSHHRFRVHQNLVKDQAIEQPDQVWVSDITYLRLKKGFCYLALITDAYSRKIIGYHVNDTLELKGCLKALQMACEQRIQLNGTTHHSDRGLQYCSNQYVDILQKHNIRISMAEAGNCYENALAERMNGILKNEFNLDATFEDINQAKRATSQAVKIYNEKRPHMSIVMKKPAELYAA